jgi:hypothetical protein
LVVGGGTPGSLQEPLIAQVVRLPRSAPVPARPMLPRSASAPARPWTGGGASTQGS